MTPLIRIKEPSFRGLGDSSFQALRAKLLVLYADMGACAAHYSGDYATIHKKFSVFTGLHMRDPSGNKIPNGQASCVFSRPSYGSTLSSLLS
ncbi:uncharacterized protein RAG0_00140 [Rhynchosporium agropyri]|uniref:Uncharacterized protein n=1 Tax=Rhynchosporium agropyri TaxID=914238 RepID=A0A1E1JR88_9HELO|nr:uncharacterized protein RAG0_00140 [Rhynchosporium agropyri]